MPAAAIFGVGAALKEYPLLFLLPLVRERMHACGRRGAIRVGVAGVGIFALINLPLLVFSPSGWGVAYRFLSLRYPNHDSLWGVLGQVFDLDRGTITTLSTLAVVIVLAAVTWGRSALFVVGSVFMYLAIFGVAVGSIHARAGLVTWLVWARTATFLLLVIAFLRASPAVVRLPDRVEGAGQHPPA